MYLQVLELVVMPCGLVVERATEAVHLPEHSRQALVRLQLAQQQRALVRQHLHARLRAACLALVPANHTPLASIPEEVSAAKPTITLLCCFKQKD
jgi:hypothetical protein